MLSTFVLALLLTCGMLGYFLRETYREERDRLTERVKGELDRLGTERLIGQLATVRFDRDSSTRDTVIDVGRFQVRRVPPPDSTTPRPEASLSVRTLSGEDDAPRTVTRSGLLQGIQLTEGEYGRVLDSLSQAFGVRLLDLEIDQPFDSAAVIIVRRDKGFWGLSGPGSSGGVAMSAYRATVVSGISLEILFSLLVVALLSLAGYLAFRNQREYVRQLREKDLLLANLSHELKSPIAAVGVALEALDAFGADERPELRRQYIQMSRTELARLDQLADYSLSVLKTRDTERLPFEALDLRAVTDRAMQSIRSRYALAASALNWEVPPQREATVEGLAQELELAVVNLLDNAVKYGGQVPRVRVRLTEEGDAWSLFVTDNGRGVAAQDRERIFERFYRATDEEAGHAVKGQGLGLSLVRQIAELHGGSVAVASPMAGTGATFCLKIPRP